MKKRYIVLGVLGVPVALFVILVIIGIINNLTSGGGGRSGGSNRDPVGEALMSGDVDKAVDIARNGESGGGSGGTASRPEDFKYDLNKAGDGVIIQGLNGTFSKIDIPEKIEGYPVVEIAYGWLGLTNNRRRPLVTSVTIPKTVTKLEGDFLTNTGITKITLPPGITEIPNAIYPDGCFRGSSLTSITIPSGITKIGGYAFTGCKSLKEVVIPDSVTEIGNQAFVGCSELTTVKLPSHPITYENRAFSGCPKLSLAVRKSITDSGYTGSF